MIVDAFFIAYPIGILAVWVLCAGTGTWLAVARWGDAREPWDAKGTAAERILLGVLGGLFAALLWPLAIPMGIVAAPAHFSRQCREKAAHERDARAEALRDAANFYQQGSDEWDLLVRAAEEVRSAK